MAPGEVVPSFYLREEYLPFSRPLPSEQLTCGQVRPGLFHPGEMDEALVAATASGVTPPADANLPRSSAAGIGFVVSPSC